MDHCPPPDELATVLSGEPAGGALALREHVDDCARCQSILDVLSDDPELARWAEQARSRPPGEVAGPGLDRLRDASLVNSIPGSRVGDRRGRPSAATAYPFLAPARHEGDLGQLAGYRVLSELGRGGMGIVLLGHDEALQRPLALKVLRPELADEQSRARFVREARAAARVRHDHVVAVYAVADPPDGLPFCALEYLAGPSLADRIRAEGRLALREAAGVVAQVADGLAAAHAAGLVHRDIKPANILSDPATGRWKLADFGLARAVAAPADGPTRVGVLVGTPAYMSPEQAAGSEDVGHASDVYSLGATLYEALTGEVPFRGSTERVLQRIAGDDPTPPRDLDASIPRDLETICLKCLAKEPHRRYADAAALAADLRRFLAREPIAARPTGFVERWAFRARRHPAVASLTACVTVATLALLGVGIAYSLRLREANRQAEADFRSALAAVNRMLTRVGGEDLADVPGMDPVRRRLLDDAQAFLRELMAAPRRSDDPAVLWEMALAHRNLARILDLLGDLGGAEAEYSRSITVFDRLNGGPPGPRPAWFELAVTRDELARTLGGIYRHAEAEAHLRVALALLEPHTAGRPEAVRLLAICCGNLAEQRSVLGDRDEAERLASRAVGLIEQATRGAAGPSPELARALTQLATVHLRHNTGPPGQCEELYRRALALWEALDRSRPASRAYQTGLAECCNGLGNVCAFSGRPPEATPLYERALATREQLASQFPHAPGVHDGLAIAYHAIGALRQKEQRNDESVAAYERSLEVRRALVREHPGIVRYWYLLAGTYQNLAMTHYQAGRDDRSLAIFADAFEALDTARRRYPAEPELVDLQAVLLSNSGLPLGRLGRTKEAWEKYDRAVRLLESASGPSPSAPARRTYLFNAHGNRAEAGETLGRYSEAVADWETVVALAAPADRDRFRLRLCLCLARSGDHARAARLAEPLSAPADLPGQVRYDLARAYALASAAALSDPSPDARDRAARGDELAGCAVAELGRAQAAGHFREPAARAALDSDPDLAPLRPRPDFRRLSAAERRP